MVFKLHLELRTCESSLALCAVLLTRLCSFMCCFLFSLAMWYVCLIHPIRFSVKLRRGLAPRAFHFSATHVDACGIQAGI